MDKYIGVITAEVKEFEAVEDIMSNSKEIVIHGLKILVGEINNRKYARKRCNPAENKIIHANAQNNM